MVPVICGGKPVSSSGAVTTRTPARPASPPARAMVRMVTVDTLAPAVAAALGFRPTALRWMPNLVRSSSHQTAAAARSASTKPR